MEDCFRRCFFMPNFALRNLRGEKGRPSCREVIISINNNVMEKTMKLVSMTPLKEREYPDRQTGELRKAHWVELTLTDGIDTMIAELTVPATMEDGRPVFRQPALEPERIYRVQCEIVGQSGNKDGRDWYMNRVNIRKIARL